MNVLHGMIEVSGQGINTVNGLRANNVESKMAVWRKDSFAHNADIDLKFGWEKWKYPVNFIKMAAFAVKSCNIYDVFHFHSGYSLLPRNLDLPLLKKSGKKIFCEFHGEDLRFVFRTAPSGFVADSLSDRQKKQQRKTIRRLLKYTDGVILHDIELEKYLPDDYDKQIYIVPLRVETGSIPYVPRTDNSIPVIVHAPSNRKFKGTEKILTALKNVKHEYRLIMVEGMDHKEALEIYKRADIIIDQISVGTYGVFAIEAMAMGKPVITYIDEEMKNSFPKELPIISADFDSLAEEVDLLLSCREKRLEKGASGRKYVEKYHDNVRVTEKLIDIYQDHSESRNVFHALERG